MFNNKLKKELADYKKELAFYKEESERLSQAMGRMAAEITVALQRNHKDLHIDLNFFRMNQDI